jgi:glycine cleavage system T protein (aminomethyltransferase)
VAVDITRTGYTGDLGYELWMDAETAVGVWDALMAAGGPYGIRPAGILALDVTRVEAGLILIEADFTSARHALNDEQRYSPYELGLGRFVNLQKPGDFVGRRALEREVAAGGPARRLVGLEIDWDGIQALFADAGLPPHVQAEASRDPIPLYAGGRQVGKATSTTWSPTLKKMIALASVAAPQSRTGIDLQVEWTVEGRRSSVSATVVELPFFDPPRRRG